MASLPAFLLLLGTFVLGAAGTNILGNGDLEDVTLGTYWSKSGCSWTISTTEKHGGAQSVHITGRSANWAGLGYLIGSPDVTSGKMYAFVGYIKLQNLAAGHLYHDVIVKLRTETLDGTKKYSNIAIHPRLRPGSWQEVGGDFKLPENIKEIKIYIQIEEKDVNYFFDDGSLVELVPDPNWRSKAESNIDLYRKAKLNIIVRKVKGIKLKTFTIEVEQKRSEFAHGTAVKAKLWTNSSYSFYNDFVYNTLKPEWAVLANALKWKGMRWTEGKLRFDDANATINDLLDNGLSLRGHNVFWGVEEWVPDWVKSITGSGGDVDQDQRED
ncbi:endo-1,4-beta-xylanase 1-like isoform X1 [Pecten maximus]|uniref:endo-1,4-beta-xylanase 1-like isoform X1 n=1 Tax=Pecten maximus TaxID=6579 RepID=UPI0014588E3C|nr:endo-1,4-beta-xylanase 1-like isoform X1 [Pecten maximus]